MDFPSFHINQEKFQSCGFVSHQTWKSSASTERFLEAGSVENVVVALPNCEHWGLGLRGTGEELMAWMLNFGNSDLVVSHSKCCSCGVSTQVEYFNSKGCFMCDSVWSVIKSMIWLTLISIHVLNLCALAIKHLPGQSLVSGGCCAALWDSFEMQNSCSCLSLLLFSC